MKKFVLVLLLAFVMLGLAGCAIPNGTLFLAGITLYDTSKFPQYTVHTPYNDYPPVVVHTNVSFSLDVQCNAKPKTYSARGLWVDTTNGFRLVVSTQSAALPKGVTCTSTGFSGWLFGSGKVIDLKGNTGSLYYAVSQELGSVIPTREQIPTGGWPAKGRWPWPTWPTDNPAWIAGLAPCAPGFFPNITSPKSTIVLMADFPKHYQYHAIGCLMD